MARARNIKPSFFRDAKVVACSFESRLLFQGLWCIADYMGRLVYEPIEIKMEVFPADNVDVEKHMEELEEKGLIQIYLDHSGRTLVHIRGFTKHQNPHINERMDKNKKPLPHLPGPNDCKPKDDGETPDLIQRVTNALVVLRDYSESDPADSLNLIPDSLKDISSKSKDSDIPHEEIIAAYHEILPERPRIMVNLWRGSKDARALGARWKQHKEHQSVDWWRALFEAVRTNDFWMNRDGKWNGFGLRWMVQESNFIKCVEWWANST